MSVCISACLSVCTSVRLYVRISVCLSVCIYVRMSVCMYVRMCVCLSVPLSSPPSFFLPGRDFQLTYHIFGHAAIIKEQNAIDICLYNLVSKLRHFSGGKRLAEETKISHTDTATLPLEH